MENTIDIPSPLAIATVHTTPFCYCDMVYRNKRFDDISEAQEAVQLGLETFKAHQLSPMPFLTDISQIIQITKEVRDFLADNDFAYYISKNAILINSGISKILGNIFLRFSKPNFPTKLFTDKQKAMAWLFSQT